MCVVSMVGDYFGDKFKDPQYPIYPYIQPFINQLPITVINVISREEFDELKKDVLEMKELLKRAKIYDEKNNEPDCEVEDKIALLRKVAALVGISLDDVLKPKDI